VRSSEGVRAFVSAFVFGTDFIADMTGLFGVELATKLIDKEALSALGAGKRCVHKIAKQLHALHDGPLKAAVKGYLAERIDEVVRIMHRDVAFDLHNEEASTMMTPVPSWLGLLQKWQSEYYTAAFVVAMRLGVQVLLMDAYLVCRMLRFSVQASVGESTSIVYVGDAHAEFYVRLLRDHLHIRPFLSVPMHAVKPPAKGTDRCVKLARTRHPAVEIKGA
jgi:hypothetical protein